MDSIIETANQPARFNTSRRAPSKPLDRYRP